MVTDRDQTITCVAVTMATRADIRLLTKIEKRRRR